MIIYIIIIYINNIYTIYNNNNNNNNNIYIYIYIYIYI